MRLSSVAVAGSRSRVATEVSRNGSRTWLDTTGLATAASLTARHGIDVVATWPSVAMALTWEELISCELRWPGSGGQHRDACPIRMEIVRKPASWATRDVKCAASCRVGAPGQMRSRRE